MKGCFYGPHHNDTWDHAESCFDLPPGNWWRLRVNRRGDVLIVTNATQHHSNFLKSLHEIVQQYPELPDNIQFDGPVVSVEALLSGSEQRISDIVFLHGTTDIFLDSILTDGLRPRSETNVCPSYGSRYDAPAGQCGWIYLTTQHNTAAMAARDAARQHGGVPVILAVGPGLREYYAEIDEDSNAFTVQESLATLGSIAYRRVVPAGMIRLKEKLVDHTTWRKVGSAKIRTAVDLHAVIEDYRLFPDLLEHFMPPDLLDRFYWSVTDNYVEAFLDDFKDNIHIITDLWWNDSKGQRTDEQFAKWLLDTDDDWCESAITSGCMTEDDRLEMLQAFRPRRGPRQRRIAGVLKKLRSIVGCWVLRNREDLDLRGLADVASRNTDVETLCNYVDGPSCINELVQEIGEDKILAYIKSLRINLDEY